MAATISPRCVVTVFLLSMSSFTLCRQLFASDFKKVNSLSEKCRSGSQGACRELAKIAEDEKNHDVRLAAVSNLTDESMLANLAMQDADPEIRRVSVRALSDQALLGRAAVSAQDDAVRAIAASKLDDERQLGSIASHDSSLVVRQIAVKRVRDQSILAEIAGNTKDPKIWQTAISNISNPELSGPLIRPQVKRIHSVMSREEVFFAPTVTITMGADGWVRSDGWHESPPRAVSPKEGMSFIIVEILFEPAHPIIISAADVGLALPDGNTILTADALLGDPLFVRRSFVRRSDGTTTASQAPPLWEPLDGEHHQAIEISDRRSLSWLFAVSSKVDVHQVKVLMDEVPFSQEVE